MGYENKDVESIVWKVLCSLKDVDLTNFTVWENTHL